MDDNNPIPPLQKPRWNGGVATLFLTDIDLRVRNYLDCGCRIVLTEVVTDPSICNINVCVTCMNSKTSDDFDVERLFLAVPLGVCGFWLWYFLIILTYYLWREMRRDFLNIKILNLTCTNLCYWDPLISNASRKYGYLIFNSDILVRYTRVWLFWKSCGW